jgi:hypothetical protein
MKGGNSGANESDLNKNNILKPNFDTLTKEGHKAFEAYRAYFKEQAKSTDELFHRLIEERDDKNLTLLALILLLLLALLVSLKPIHQQVVHRWAALQCSTPQSSR